MVRAIPVRAETIQVVGESGSLVISGEFSGSSVGIKTLEPEHNFTTLPTSALSPTPMNLGEGTFTTLAVTVLEQPVSSETIFQTLPLPIVEGGLSVEETFTTADNTPPDDGGGGSSGSGGGSSGGGSGGGGVSSGGSRRIVPVAPVAPTGVCPVYLTKFIRLGVKNDPIEVLKLQRFLRDFEGFSNVPLSGVYDIVTYQAVRVFQTRYAKDILTPWGIDYPTGYVYITTTLAINNLHCERSPATTLDLRSHLSSFDTGVPAGLIVTTTGTGTPEFLEVGQATSTSRLLTAALGVLDFFKQIPPWWWIILLLIIFYLIFELIREKRRHQIPKSESDPNVDEVDSEENIR